MSLPNRLAAEPSPYLLQHSHNPVDWYPWGEEAFGKARERDVPVFLSIGYSSCHWCHVMERESFEDEATAAAPASPPAAAPATTPATPVTTPAATPANP